MLSVSLLVACGGGVGESTPISEPETLVLGRTLDERVEVYRLLVNCERFGA